MGHRNAQVIAVQDLRGNCIAHCSPPPAGVSSRSWNFAFMIQAAHTLGEFHWLPIIIFIVTYLLIAIDSGRGSHLDRTASAFCGAVAMVLAGAISLDSAYRAISWDTIIFLLGIMILVAHFQMSHFFSWVAVRVAAVARTRLQLLIFLAFTVGILSAFFVNDTICLIFTPVVLAVTDRLRLPKLPYLVTLATSANIGSVMSVTGNPQNALVGVTAHFTFLDFLKHLAPVALLGLSLNVIVLAILFRREVWNAAPLEPHSEPIAVTLDRHLLSKCALAALLVLAMWILGFSFPLAAAAVGAFILIIGRVKSENVYHHIDWELLLFFAALFVVMRGFEESGAVGWLLQFFEPGLKAGVATQLFAISGTMLVLSNLVSNVPAVLLVRSVMASFPHTHFLWLAVASTSTLAGNATPLSSVANLIVIQLAARRTKVTFWEFTRAGIIVTVVTTLAAIAVLALEAHFFPQS
ncbi:MAG TPA: SLC13 family permease [Candidatus Acidoferrales bacterium]|nr:SLC13 family permease [Candidatus Acidoferrales bacterium]